MAASRDGSAQHDVFLPGVAHEQNLECGQRRHVERGVVFAGERLQHGDERWRNREAIDSASITRLRWPWPIGWQVERRNASQLPPPVRTLLLENRAAHAPTLP